MQYPNAIPKIQGFQEVIFSVSNLDAAERFYSDTVGFEVRHRDQASSKQSVYWRLAPDSVIAYIAN